MFDASFDAGPLGAEVPVQAPFQPRWRSGEAKFQPWGQCTGQPEPFSSNDVPETDATGADLPPDPWAEGYAAGYAAATQELAERAAEQNVHAAALTASLARLGTLPPAEVMDAMVGRIRELLTALVGTASVDAQLLHERTGALLALLPEQAEAVLELHVEDAALLQSLDCPPGLTLRTVADLTRGEVRLVEGMATHCAGPMTMLDQMYDGQGDAV